MSVEILCADRECNSFANFQRVEIIVTDSANRDLFRELLEIIAVLKEPLTRDDEGG